MNKLTEKKNTLYAQAQALVKKAEWQPIKHSIAVSAEEIAGTEQNGAVARD